MMQTKKVANKKTDSILNQMEAYRNTHEEWKNGNIKLKKGFFPIFNDFKSSHLVDISGGALKAYIYFGMHANNSTGECWHSNEKMCDFFGVDIRTMKKWVAELEERNLIRRVQVGYKRAANTFIIPYHDAESEDEIQF